MNKLFNKETLDEILEDLNTELAKAGVFLELTIYGGAIMTLVYNNRPSTKDIDSVLKCDNMDIVNDILSIIKDKHSLSNDWINDEIKGPIKFLKKEDIEVFRIYSNLAVKKPVAAQILAMKILAARREPSKDFIDSYLLCKSLNISTKEQLLKVISAYIPLSLVGERQMIFIKYLGEDLGYDWE